MKVGDLVRMKYELRNRRADYTDDFGIVCGLAGKGLKVLMPNGKIKVGLIDHWETINI